MKPLPYLIITLLLLTIVTAIVPTESYKGVNIKVYDNTSISRQDVYDLIDELQPYLNGTTLRIMKNNRFNPSWCALYWQPDLIDLFCLDTDSIIHEITHRLQYQNKGLLYHRYYHSGRFCEFYKEVSESYTGHYYKYSEYRYC